jgi:hypothetical protein
VLLRSASGHRSAPTPYALRSRPVLRDCSSTASHSRLTRAHQKRRRSWRRRCTTTVSAVMTRERAVQQQCSHDARNHSRMCSLEKCVCCCCLLLVVVVVLLCDNHNDVGQLSSWVCWRHIWQLARVSTSCEHCSSTCAECSRRQIGVAQRVVATCIDW